MILTKVSATTKIVVHYDIPQIFQSCS